MRKNGFTLIELLAVIVILAIIALIATPIILGIINDARKESQERSVELYASAIKNGIAAYQLREMKEVVAGTYTSETLPFDVEYDGQVGCTTIELYEDGGVYVAGCTVNDTEVEYTYGTKQVAKGTMGICNPLEVQIAGTYTAGDKYECDVDPEKQGYDYIFYVLNSDGASVNLIMDSNITSIGVAIKDTNTADKGLVAWYEDDIDNSYGPITAMNHLQTATAGWINVNELTTNKFLSCSDKTTCTDKPMTEYVVNARMPYLSEVSDYDGNNAYLYDNLDFTCVDENGEDTSCDEAIEKYGVFEEGINHVEGVYGYWTLCSDSHELDYAWSVNYYGYVDPNAAENISIADKYHGVRPVINLSI